MPTEVGLPRSHGRLPKGIHRAGLKVTVMWEMIKVPSNPQSWLF